MLFRSGGMTTGEPLVVRVAMKPISTLMSPLKTVDLATGAEANAQSEQLMGHLIGALIKARVGELLLFAHQGDRFGGSEYLCLEQFVQALLWRKSRGGSIPLIDELLILSWREQGQGVNRLARLLHDSFQQSMPMVQQILDGLSLKQIGAVFHPEIGRAHV